MKKRNSFLLGIVTLMLLFGVLFVGCLTVPKTETKVRTVDAGRFDATVPASTEATLRIGVFQGVQYESMITKFDGIDVQWNANKTVETGGSMLVPTFIHVQTIFSIRVPSGNHTLTGVGAIAAAGGSTVKETSSRVNFVAGKTYNIAVINGVIRTEEVTQ